jgi:hypothetical protein
MKKFLRSVLLLLFLSFAVLSGCPTEASTEETPDVPLASLTDTVWGGIGPRASNNDFVTLTFKTADKVVVSFTYDGYKIPNYLSYTYDAGKKSGNIEKGIGDFTISKDAKTIAFSAWYGHATPSFRQLRDADLTAASSPSGLAALPSDLKNTVWAGSTPQESGKGWFSIMFLADGKAMVAFTADTPPSGSHEGETAYDKAKFWNFAYNATTKAGTFTSASDGTGEDYKYHKDNNSTGNGGTWIPSETFSIDGNVITFPSWMSSPRSFNRYF